MGSETTHAPSHLPLPHILCDTPGMKRLLILPVLLLTLLVGNPAFSAEYQKGLTAYESGDFATALREWKPLAKQGYAPAQSNLGVMYENGLGVPQDYKAAVRWYTLATEQGNAIAQYNLGGMYDKGRRGSQDDKATVKWLKLAAEQGSAIAQYNLAVMYTFGKGVIKDYVYAYMWGNIAATNGNKKGTKLRNFVSKRVTPSQLETAQKLARECIRKKYKGC
jgi:TPR repeat protein